MSGYSPYGPGPYPNYPTYASIGYGFWYAFIIVLFIILLVGGGFYYYRYFIKRCFLEVGFGLSF